MLITDTIDPAANSYASLDDLKQYASGRGYLLPGNDASCERLLRVAMDYLEGMNWRGCRTSSGQSLSWPRRGVVCDGVVLSANTVPRRVIDAQCRLAVEAQTVELQPTLNGEATILSESIAGAISVSYNPDQTGKAPSFPWLNTLLKGMATSASQVQIIRG
ncbi:hypothetical protein HPX80_002184 [Salmonella enterica]|nr:hypothetical protein [Salmonella enterica]